MLSPMVWRPRLRHRATLAKRDAAFLWQSFVRGKRPSPLVDRPKGHRGEVVALHRGVRLRPLRIVETRRETADARSFFVTEMDGSEVAFEAGQFLTLELTVGGERVRRAYSFAGPALPGAPRHFTVKRIDGGKVSTFLQEATLESIEVLGPSGAFVRPTGARHLVCVAGGSGITPVISIVETALAADPEARVTLLYGNRSQADTIFFERLAQLAAEHPERLRVVHEWDGVLDAERQRRFFAAITDDASTHYFVCGPTPMMDASREALRGVPAARVHEERFASPARGPRTLGPQLVTIRIDGRDRKVQSTTTLLEAGLAAGLDMPFSCAMGGCAACKVKLHEGDVVMDETACLTPEEREAGYVLACCSRAASPCTIEVEP